eukprot:NODE_16_length_41655_cov_0.272813.p11 type:complete len:329 gc:universal NODE_16_length_41655_cov_0.272813:21007-21993(+)
MSQINHKSSKLRLFDIGANLTDDVFRGKYRGKHKHEDDFDEIINRSMAMGVEHILVTGTTLEESKIALELVKRRERMYSTIGVHPTRCSDLTDDTIVNMKEIIDLKESKIKAIGEIGLDYDRLQFCDKEKQLKGYELQLEMAKQYNLPLFLHDRNTGLDFYNVTKKHISDLNGGVVHSFTSSMEQMKRLVELGLYIGINGCSLKTEENINVVRQIPLRNIMLETDCPWCSIKRSHAGFKYFNDNKLLELQQFGVEYPKVEYRFPSYAFDLDNVVGKPEKWVSKKMVKNRNEPSSIIKVLCIVSGIKDVPVKELAEAAFLNSKTLFNVK